MNTPNSRRQDVMVPSPQAVSKLETRDLARAALAPLQLADAHATVLAETRSHMDVVLNADAERDSRNKMVERVLAVNKLLIAVGARKKVTGLSALGPTVIENKGNGEMHVNVLGKGVSYEFTVDSDGNVEGAASTLEASSVGAGKMNPALLVDIANTLTNLMAPN